MSKKLYFEQNQSRPKSSVVSLDRRKMHMRVIKFPTKVEAIHYKGFSTIYDVEKFAKKYYPEAKVFCKVNSSKLLIAYDEKEIELEYGDVLMLHNEHLHQITEEGFKHHYESK
jgi:hypothetical protein